MSGQNSQHRKNETLEEKVQKIFTELRPDTNSTQISGSVFADGNEQLKTLNSN